MYDQKEIKTLKDSFVAPRLSRNSLSRNVARFMEMTGEIVAEGHFDLHLENLAAFRQYYGSETQDIVFVLSTGRCGTLGLYEFIKKSQQAMPYHTLTRQLLPLDRNHLLYRIIGGNLDKSVLTKILGVYLETRSAEILFACRNGKTPVIVNHWDTVFAPFDAVLFPGSTFIHLHRDETKVFKSIYGKGQLNNNQLQYFRYDPSFPDGRFIFFQDESLGIEQEVAWYLFVTREFIHAFAQTVGDGRLVSIKSEDLFARSREHFDLLRQAVPIDDLGYEDFCKSYEAPVNPKSEKLQVEEDELDRRAARIPGLMVDLERDGGY